MVAIGDNLAGIMGIPATMINSVEGGPSSLHNQMGFAGNGTPVAVADTGRALDAPFAGSVHDVEVQSGVAYAQGTAPVFDTTSPTTGFGGPQVSQLTA